MKDLYAQNHLAGWQWLLKMAWRDGKASSKRLLLFIASIVFGIAAVVAIQSFGENLKQNMALQSKALMGADYKIDSNHPPKATVSKLMDSLGGYQSREISFPSMAAFSSTEATKLVQVRGIEGNFPFYGVLETDPSNAEYQLKNAALVDATVMLQLGLQPGDSIKLGKVSLPILASLKSIPGSNAVFSSIAPPVIIPFDFIEKTELVQTGSRVNYDFYFLDPNTDLEALDESIDATLDAEDADLDTHLSTSQRLGRRYDNFGKFLNLVAFIALLLGCVGIASSVQIYIKEKVQSIAVLKCLGADNRQVFLIYLLQVLAIGFAGGFMGTFAGVLLQQLFPYLLGDLIPVSFEIAVFPTIIFVGILLGVVMSVLFSLNPLISTLHISPLQALRVEGNQAKKKTKTQLYVSASIVLFIFLFALWVLRNPLYALSFVLGIALTFLILAAVASLFIKLIKKYFPVRWHFPARQGVKNLFRPQNQTHILVLAIGIGTFLISTLYFTKDLLLAQAEIDAQANNPNLILLDVQSEQRQAVKLILTNAKLELTDEVPIVTMRIHAIKGVLSNTIRQDSTSRINQWILNHEFRVTYRDSLIASEEIQQGKWIGKVEDNKGVIPISVSDNLARDAEVTVGDTLTFNVQGVLMKTQVSSIRTVDWGRVQLNFTVLFPRGVLENAPQFWVLSTHVPDEAASASVQQDLVRDLPNISVIDLRQVLALVESLLGKIAWLINFMAFFSILTGLIVLLGALKTSKYQRIKENVLLRTLGAKGSQIFKIVLFEYGFLGLLGSFTGVVLSLISSQVMAIWLFDAPFIPSWVPFLVLIPGIVLLVIFVGLTNSLSVIKSPPLSVLRKEANL
jgi:putative ABC transport system permease protein